jgi:hypothetical protein
MEIEDAKLAAACDAVIEQLEGGDRIQGFLYGDTHVVRDLDRRSGEDEVWRMKTDDYESGHSAMMREIDRMRAERIVRAVAAAFAS